MAMLHTLPRPNARTENDRESRVCRWQASRPVNALINILLPHHIGLACLYEDRWPQLMLG